METSRSYNFKPVEELVFSDDFMFGAVMREPDICKGVLERLLKIKIDRIEYTDLQKHISPFYSKKGVRLDVYVSGSDKVFDVECQSYKIEDIGKRTRYYQAMIDTDSLMKGAVYSELKESFVIFICLDDPFCNELPTYTFERECKENKDVKLGDMTHHVIFNAAAYGKEQDPNVRAFLSFVKNNMAEDEFTRGISNMVQTKKFEQTFINDYLAWNLHETDVERRGREEGLKEGRKDGRVAMCAELIQSGLLSVKDAALKLGMPEEELKKRL